MNIDLNFLLHYEQRAIIFFPDELSKFKKLLRKIGIECKPKKASRLIGKHNMGRFGYDTYTKQGKCEIYLDELEKSLSSTSLSLEEGLVSTLTHEYLHVAMSECIGNHQEDWIECLTEMVLR